MSPADTQPAAGLREPLILASGSPQRTAILTQLGVPHVVHVADVVEEEHGAPDAVAERNAISKALAVAADHPGRVVVGSDTVVFTEDGELLGKPTGRAHAEQMLEQLLGRTHTVLSGLAIVGPEPGRLRSGVDTTLVQMRRPTAEAIARYLDVGEWEGRAGAYAIQGRGAGLVQRIDGDYLNVVGLPVALLSALAPELLDAPAAVAG